MKKKIKEILKESIVDNPDVLEWQIDQLEEAFNKELERRELEKYLPKQPKKRLSKKEFIKLANKVAEEYE